MTFILRQNIFWEGIAQTWISVSSSVKLVQILWWNVVWTWWYRKETKMSMLKVEGLTLKSPRATIMFCFSDCWTLFRYPTNFTVTWAENTKLHIYSNISRILTKMPVNKITFSILKVLWRLFSKNQFLIQYIHCYVNNEQEKKLPNLYFNGRFGKFYGKKRKFKSSLNDTDSPKIMEMHWSVH